MKNKLLELARNTRNKVLVVGYDNQDFMNTLKKNKKVTRCDTLIELTGFMGKKKKTMVGTNTKKVRIKKIGKAYKKDHIDYMFIDGLSMKKYLRKFIKNSIFITNDKIYFFANETKLDSENIKKRFERYNANVKVISYDDDYVLEIDVKDKKNHPFKKYLYFLIDLLYDMKETIGDVIST